ncbi:RecT family recombinase [Enterobacter hormaechei subsp. xiangfangensis]|uniref:RecT family recombinase n=1 Tax=Enterobacter hormaechei TaxID=158836 RepID=UPI0018C2F3E2|nr:RecT family recombinase [Enterobacter hormaechei]MBG0520233.1 recombinase RecT [Enterobacter hormaechei]MCU3460772.1 recombinase RecT [Enterobacter hormaechei subsp. xiangfangensis]MCU3464256.1 recombinase RecT [Enterobacter hormaechei subsp. xiangfangensis]MCW4793276.1 recombinase RecT [Enterobacter hormaechei subsp. xiangfangensis]MCW5048196.1 recombinase RecT [Enterobacter hormaechei subsp. xiangfangensis]
MQNTNVTVADQNTVINSNVALFDSQYLNAISTFAQIMAQGTATVPKHLQGNQADCMAVAMQAAQWQMNPFAVAQKTHLINGVLGYEAQLVNAVISRSGVLASRFEYEWYGPWEKVVGKFHIRKGEKGEYRVPGWTLADEAGIGIIIRATLKGEDQPRELDLLLAQARTRNSTLWADDPRQQLAYLAVKRWARLFCPDVILGVYTPDELDDRREEREVNPAPVQHISLTEITDDNLSTTQNAQQSSVNIDTLADEYRKRIDSAETLDDATTVGNDINASKSVLGAALHTELKNKATRRYHFVNAKNKVDTAIKALPKPGVEGAEEHFEEVEKMLLAAKRHLGDELHDKYRITLDDMKPEYVA